MKAIKLLQITTVVMFAIMVVAGVVTFIAEPSKLDDFGKLIGIIWPVFLTMVVPALIGSPLTEAVKTISAAKAAQIAGATPPSPQ